MNRLSWLATVLLLTLSPTVLSKLQQQDPATVSEEGYRLINRQSIYFKIIGDKSKPPLIMVHGGPGFDHHHMLGMNTLAKHYQLIYYDQRGSGNSSGQVNAASITMANFISDLDEIRKSFNIDRANIVATSFGGLIALHYALRYPEHINTLTLVASVPASLQYFDQIDSTIKNRTSKTDQAYLNRIEQSPGYQAGEKSLVQQYYRLFFKAYAYNSAHVKQLNLEFGPATLKNMSSINQFMYQNLGEFNLYPQLTAITSPTLILHGDSDPFPYQAVQAMHNKLKNSQLILYKQTGHFLYLEQATQLFSDIEHFLEQHITIH